MSKIIITPQTEITSDYLKLPAKLVLFKYDDIQPFEDIYSTDKFHQLGLCYLYQKAIFDVFEFKDFGYCDNWSPSVNFFKQYIYPLMEPFRPEGIEENTHWWNFDSNGADQRHTIIVRVLYQILFPNNPRI